MSQRGRSPRRRGLPSPSALWAVPRGSTTGCGGHRVLACAGTHPAAASMETPSENRTSSRVPASGSHWGFRASGPLWAARAPGCGRQTRASAAPTRSTREGGGTVTPTCRWGPWSPGGGGAPTRDREARPESGLRPSPALLPSADPGHEALMGRRPPHVLAAASGRAPRAREEDAAWGRALPGCPPGMEPRARHRPEGLGGNVSGWGPAPSSGVGRRSLCTPTPASGGPGSLPAPLHLTPAQLFCPSPQARAFCSGRPPRRPPGVDQSHSLLFICAADGRVSVSTPGEPPSSWLSLTQADPRPRAHWGSGPTARGWGPPRAWRVPGWAPGAGASPPQGVTTKHTSRHGQLGANWALPENHRLEGQEEGVEGGGGAGAERPWAQWGQRALEPTPMDAPTAPAPRLSLLVCKVGPLHRTGSTSP